MAYRLQREELDRVRELLDQLRRREGFGERERQELRSLLSKRDARVESMRLHTLVRFAKKLLDQREAR
ncbi:hypothetical protein BRD56_05275 [Thermoplasmatales archaeon SW_10_69_26]|nr:MAG: hypothetical protein BRD56_05275 [Thermoplasmatales archaeon SW_10_69_26]